jgi:hypothetical protein
MVHGVNPATFLILPMLGKHPDEYPRFRDCFITEDDHILILTRVGGPNRDEGYGQEEMEEDPHFIKTYDADWDWTYGYYEFSVPDEWKADFDAIKNGGKPSKEYLEQMCKVYPKLADKFREQFKEKEAQDESVENQKSEEETR